MGVTGLMTSLENIGDYLQKIGLYLAPITDYLVDWASCYAGIYYFDFSRRELLIA